MGYLQTMGERVSEALRQRYMTRPVARPSSLPVVRLEMHPRVQHEIYADPETMYLLQSTSRGTGDLEGLFRVPVRVTSEMPDGQWRLVAVSETVLASGGGEPLAIVPRDD